ASTLLLGLLAHHTLVDVRTLLMNGTEHTAGIGLEHVLAPGVSNALDHFTCDLLHVQIGLALYLACQNHLPCGDQGFTSHLALRIECKKMVYERIADLIGDLVRVSFADAFGCEEVWHVQMFGVDPCGKRGRKETGLSRMIYFSSDVQHWTGP